MNTTLDIKGFKCFFDDKFVLKKITLLTGSNGTGKSSLIQALLLSRLAIEKNLSRHKNQDYLLGDKWNDILIPLNNGYNLKLGTIYDIIRERDNKQNKISVTLDDETLEFGIPSNEEYNTSVNVRFTKKKQDTEIPFWRKKEFYYLNTERLGPRYSLESNFTDFVHCGFKGEFTAQVLVNISPKTDFVSAMLPASRRLDQEVNHWLELVCPGTKISASAIGTMAAQIKVSNSVSSSDMLATNIGFGISYVLPIIVTGLIALKGTAFLVENPEAHLHPKGQSNIGYFLGMVAASGVKVIVETHSEHVVNGMRRALLSSELMTTDDASIYFFNGFNENKQLKVENIVVEDDGSLSSFPKDFFDQVNQDLGEIFKLANS